MRNLHAQFQVVEPDIRVHSILKHICDLILKKSRINVIGLDVGKGLQDDMIINDMNSSIVILDRLNVKGVGSSL